MFGIRYLHYDVSVSSIITILLLLPIIVRSFTPSPPCNFAPSSSHVVINRISALSAKERATNTQAIKDENYLEPKGGQATQISRSDFFNNFQELQQKIKECEDMRAILDICQNNKSDIRPAHVSFCWNQMSRLSDYKQLKKIEEDPRLLKPIIDRTVESCGKMNPRSLAITSHRIAKLSLRAKLRIGSRIWVMLENRAIEMDKFDSKDISILLWAFAKAGQKAPALFDHFENLIISRIDGFNAQGISNILWAYAKVGHRSPDLFDAAAGEAIKKFDSYNSQDISNIVWSYATVGLYPYDLFYAAAEEAIKKLDTFKSREISIMLWSCATAGHPFPKLLDAATREAMKRFNKFNSQGISNIVWSHATIGHRSPELFDAAAREAIKQLDTFKPQEIANTVWSYAKVGHPSQELFNAAAREAIQKLDTFKPQEISSMLWAYASAGHFFSPELFDAAGGEAMKKLDSFKPQEISNMLWAYATVGYASPELFDAAAGEAIKQFDTFKSQEISNTLWSYATLSHRSSELFDAAAGEAIKKLHTFEPQEISNMLWSYATIGHFFSPELFEAAAGEAMEKMDSFKPQEICNTLWSLAVKDYNVESAIPLLNHVINLHESNQLVLSIAEQVQLHQVLLWVSRERKQKSPIPDDLANKCLSAFIGNPSNPSQLEKEVVSVFRSLGFEVRDEGICKQTGYSIDAIVTTKSGNEIAVEVDGPTHFVGPVPTGARVLKRRQLDNLGETPLLSLPYWRWNELATTEEKQNYLEGEMKRILSETH